MKRFNAFLKVSATELITQIAVTPIAALMMKRASWLPLFLSSAINPISYVLCLRLVETRPCRTEETSQPPFPPEREESDPQDQEDQKTIKRGSLKGLGSLLKSTKSLLCENSRVAVLLSVFFIACFGKESLGLLLQYISKRYDWDYGQVW